MIAYRRWEIKKESVSVEDGIGGSLIPVEDIIAVGKKCYTCIPRESMRRFYSRMASYGEKALYKSIARIKNAPLKIYMYTLIDAIKGRRLLRVRKDSTPSSFIRDMLAHKEQIRNSNKEQA